MLRHLTLSPMCAVRQPCKRHDVLLLNAVVRDDENVQLAESKDFDCCFTGNVAMELALKLMLCYPERQFYF